jgi:hypothetical protein
MTDELRVGALQAASHYIAVLEDLVQGEAPDAWESTALVRLRQAWESASEKAGFDVPKGRVSSPCPICLRVNCPHPAIGPAIQVEPPDEPFGPIRGRDG